MNNTPTEIAAMAAVVRADTRAALLKAMPLPEQQDLFPGMRSERAEFYIEQIRALVYGPATMDPALHWWNEQMTRRDRRFICRVARVDVALAERSWLELEPTERARALAAFHHLREWVQSFHPPLSPFIPLAFEPSP